MPDALAAELAAIGDRAARSDNLEVWTRVAAAERDRDRLLGALKAVLGDHVPVNRGRVLPCCEGCEQACCACPADCCHEWMECPVRETVLRELLSKEGSDGG